MWGEGWGTYKRGLVRETTVIFFVILLANITQLTYSSLSCHNPQMDETETENKREREETITIRHLPDNSLFSYEVSVQTVLFMFSHHDLNSMGKGGDSVSHNQYRPIHNVNQQINDIQSQCRNIMLGHHGIVVAEDGTHLALRTGALITAVSQGESKGSSASRQSYSVGISFIALTRGRDGGHSQCKPIG